MPNIVKAFESAELGNVRVVVEGDNLWFVAKDVLLALGYAESSAPAKVMELVPVQWKGVKPFHIRSENGVEQSRDLICLTEQGLYFFLGRSDKPKALPYQMWIAGEVVPSIRKTGSYSVAPEKPGYELAESAARVAKLALETAGLTPNQVAIGISNTYRHQTGIDVLAASEMLLPAPVQQQALSPTDIGIEIGDMSAVAINRLLAEHGFQTRLANKTWNPTEAGAPYALLLDTAKRHSDGTPVVQVKWYANILPIIRGWLDTSAD